LSVAYVGPKSKTQRPRKTKIGTQVAHVTRDSVTTFKVKRSNFKVTRPLYSPRVNASGSCNGERGNALSVRTYCYVAVCRRGGRLGGARRFGAHRGKRGAGTHRDGRPPTACYSIRTHKVQQLCSTKCDKMLENIAHQKSHRVRIADVTPPHRRARPLPISPKLRALSLLACTVIAPTSVQAAGAHPAKRRTSATAATRTVKATQRRQAARPLSVYCAVRSW